MMPAQLKDTTMSPATRTLIRVTIAEDEGETGDLVERLMGKRPELRFQYIQENARFVERRAGRVIWGRNTRAILARALTLNGLIFTNFR